MKKPQQELRLIDLLSDGMSDDALEFRSLLKVLNQTSCPCLVDIVGGLEGVVEVCVDVIGAVHEG